MTVRNEGDASATSVEMEHLGARHLKVCESDRSGARGNTAALFRCVPA